MIGRLMRMAGAMVAYFCIATLISQVVIAAYLSVAWGLDREKIAAAMSVARGVAQVQKDGAEGEEDQIAPEQVSYDEVLKERAVKVRYLELREEALANGLSQLAFEQGKLADDRARFAQQKTTFETELAMLDNGAKAQGIDENRRTLETIKPKQAKEQLMLMLEQKELDKVVILLAAMTDAKRAKIAGEFKTPEEAEKLSEILRKIREGIPKTEIVGQTQKQMQAPDAAGT